MNKKQNIKKIKNFEGYYFICEKCGKEIKHAFMINGKGCYGSECVINMVKNADKKIKNEIKKHNLIIKMMNNKEIYSWNKYKNAHGFINDNQLIDHFLKYNRLG